MSHSAEALWQRAIPLLREKVPERTIQNWFADAEPESDDSEEDGSSIRLRVPTSFSRDYLQRNFRREIKGALEEASGRSVSLSIIVDESLDKDCAAGDSIPPSKELDLQEGSSSNPQSSDSAARGSGRSTPEDGATQNRTPSTETRQDPVDRSSASPPSGTQSTPEAKGSVGRAESSSPPLPSAHTIKTSSRRKKTDGSPPVPSPGTGRGKAEGQDEPAFSHSANPRSNLRSEFTFEQFLEGDSNRLARSASVAVAKHPGETDYNPLVVYGEVGLGKTHLAQAIANFSVEHATAEKIRYVSSERFTSEFVTAIREDRFSAFSDYYRSVDLLVVDDVQFLEGKEKTQEEFFHLFNDLHQHGKQIVLCADRPPSRIEGIEERLLSRFQWGLTADIQRPDLEMRLAVLQMKAENLGLDLAPEIYDVIAESITENVRQLEGALKQLSAHSQLIEGNLSVDDAREILGDEIGLQAEPRQPNVEEIIRAVADHHSLSADDLISRGRKQKISNARQIAMYFSRELTDLSYASIGRRFGGRDHSTVIHACRKIRDYIDVQSGFEEDLTSVRSRIRREVCSK